MRKSEVVFENGESLINQQIFQQNALLYLKDQKFIFENLDNYPPHKNVILIVFHVRLWLLVIHSYSLLPT